MVARQESARRRRLLQARIGAGAAGVVVIAAVAWIIVAANSGDTTTSANPSGPLTCSWSNISDDLPTETPGATPSLPEGIKDVGLPPVEVPRSGYQILTMETDQGTIKIEMDLAKTPCTAASMAHLASKGFYDGTSCHRLVPDINALQCGDPSGTGSGGAAYRFADENLPTNKLPAYHGGDVAMANTGQPGTNGSQFFFVYENNTLQGDYSLWGRVIEGLDVVKKIGAGGDDGAYNAEGQAGGGHPKIPVKFTKVTVGPVNPTSQVKPTTPAPTSAAASPSTSPATSPTA